MKTVCHLCHDAGGGIGARPAEAGNRGQGAEAVWRMVRARRQADSAEAHHSGRVSVAWSGESVRESPGKTKV